MSDYQRTGNSLYLQPMANIKEYQVVNAAKMLCRMRHFASVATAHSYLHHLELNYPWQFKAIMSKYYDIAHVKHMFRKTMPIDNYTTSKQNVYGDEPHMYM